MDRTKGIGGSDIAALMGLSPWKTAYDVYLDKIGENTQEDKPHLAAGREAQSAVLRRYEQYAETVVEQEDIEIIHPTYPFLLGNVDGIANGGKTYVEAKTTRDGIEDWNYQIPPYYRTQVAFYAALGNPDLVDVAVAYWFNPHKEMKHFTSLTYWREEAFEKSVVDCAVEFWEESVLKRNPPELRTLSDIKKRYGQSISSAIEATSDVKDALKELKGRMEIQKQLETEIEGLKFQIQQYAGANEGITNESGSYLVLLRTQERTGIDSHRLKKEQPHLFAHYSKTTHSRPFKLLRSA